MYRNQALSVVKIAETICIGALWLTIPTMAGAYEPPQCNDTDVDTTNDCSPDDSSDAGTR